MNQVDWQNLTELEYRPRAKLFLSVDIVGSTALKQRQMSRESRPEWPAVISAFYGTSRSAIDGAWDEAERACEEEKADKELLLGPSPKFWKTIGDEVIFWKDVTLETQVWMTIACWMRVIKDLRDWIADYRDPAIKALDVKGTIWLASFPIRNRVIVAHEVGTEEYRRTIEYLYGDGVEINASSFDFIGAGIDIGFRVSQFSTSQRMSIDLGTALLMAKSQGRINDRAGTLNWSALLPSQTGRVVDLDNKNKIVERLGVFYDGSSTLKGVLGGMEYPRFWIDSASHDSMEYHQEQLIYPKENRRIRQKWSVIGDFCESVYRDRKSFIREPYLEHGNSTLKKGRDEINRSIEDLRKERIDKLTALEVLE